MVPHPADVLSISLYAFVAVYILYGGAPVAAYLLFTFLSVFILLGWHIVRALVNRGVLPAQMDLGLVCALIPTIGVSASVVVGSIEYGLQFRPAIVGLAIATAIVELIAFLTRSSTKRLTKGLDPSQVYPILGIVAVPIFQFTLGAYLSSPPSPFPYFVGWDTFTYMMLAGRAYSGSLSFPTTDINPVTQQLPIPVGFPLFASMLFAPGGTYPSIVVLLMKFGALAPAIMGMLWTFSILRKATSVLFATVGSILAYSFAGAGVIDTKWFLPASFAWVFSLALVYFLLFEHSSRSKAILSLTFAMTALFFHLYTSVATIAITLLGLVATKAIGLNSSKTNRILAKAYPVFGVIAVVVINALGLSFVIAGGGEVMGSPLLLQEKMVFLSRTLLPAAWIIGIFVSFYAVGQSKAWKNPANFLLISLLLYLVPVSAAFRILFWPATFAVLMTMKAIEVVTNRLVVELKTPHSRVAKLIPGVFAVMLLASAIYPALVSQVTPPVYYITDSGRLVQSNYSFSEFSSAVFLRDSPPADSYLIMSDPGYSLVLGGLTGQEAVRLTRPSNMKPFQDLLLQAGTLGFNATTAMQLTKLLEVHFDLSRYNGIVLAFSARTYYWTLNYGVITWAPSDPKYVNNQTRTILAQSPVLDHIFANLDVDLFYLSLSSS